MALIQLAVSANKASNLDHATELISKAAKQGAQLLALPVDIDAYLQIHSVYNVS